MPSNATIAEIEDFGNVPAKEFYFIELHHEPLIEITKDKKQIWIEDKLVWEAEN